MSFPQSSGMCQYFLLLSRLSPVTAGPRGTGPAGQRELRFLRSAEERRHGGDEPQCKYKVDPVFVLSRFALQVPVLVAGRQSGVRYRS